MADQIFSVNAGFFDAVNYDRTYTANDMNRPYSRVLADGVFAANAGTPSSDLQVVSAGSGMNISVKAGQGIFGQKWFENPSAILITVPANNDFYPRFDAVIVQIDNRTSGRVGNIVYRTGTPASNPQYPTINAVANVIEYAVAYVYVAAGVTVINDDVITDLRGSNSCPWVTGLIQQVDTSTLWSQFQAAYLNQFNEFTSDYNEYIKEQRQAWEDFLKTLTSELSVATNVLLLDSTYTATGTVINVPINIPSYNHDTDVLQVFINGLFASEGEKYTIDSSGTTITLMNAITSGNIVYFVVFKSVIGADIESAISMMLRLDDKIENFMADSGWIDFYLENGATAFDSNTTPGVRCIGNRVYLRGAVKDVTSAGLTICTLPVAYRPSMDHTFTTSAINDTTANNYITITISATTGAVQLSATSDTISSSDKISLATSFLAND